MKQDELTDLSPEQLLDELRAHHDEQEVSYRNCYIFDGSGPYYDKLASRAMANGGAIVTALADVVERGEDQLLATRAISLLGRMGPIAIGCLSKQLDQIDDTICRASARALARVGLPAIDVLTRALVHRDVEVRQIAVKGLGNLGLPALAALTHALDDPEPDVRVAVVDGLWGIGEPAFQALVRVLLNDEDPAVRHRVIWSGTGSHDGREIRNDWAIRLLAIACEDPHKENLAYGGAYVYQDSGYSLLPEESLPDPVQAASIFVDEHIIRVSGSPSSRFHIDITATILKTLLTRELRIGPYVLERLCEIAFLKDGEVRQRAVDVARSLGANRFAPLVKARADKDPKAAAEIMDRLGGEESTAFFTKQQSQTLEQYRAPLLEVERIGRQRWEELTQQARISFWISTGMSVGLFVVGTVIIFWGLRLVANSQDFQQQIAGGLLTAAAGLATTFSGRFWKDPVEHIQRFSAQQARLQTTFIGFMNRLAQLRLVFEQDYADEGVPLDVAEAHQRLLGDAIDQASRQLGLFEGVPQSEQTS